MTPYHPWRAFRHFAEWTLRVAPLPDEQVGETCWESKTVTVAAHLNQAERRSTIAHEVAHIERGPFLEVFEAREERRVSVLAARRLITFEALESAYRWANNLRELADELWVDEDTVQVRLEHLHPSERMKLIEILRERQ